MIKLTDKHRKVINENIELWRQHCLKFPKKRLTSKGKLFWRDHPAKSELREDTKSGKTKNEKPSELWESSDKYKEFPMVDFCKHIYQEKYLLLAGPYWQNKRNKVAMKEHKDSVNKLYQEWQRAKWEIDTDELTEAFKNI